MLSFCSQLFLFTSLEFVFFYSIIFDIFVSKFHWSELNTLSTTLIQRNQAFSDIAEFSLSSSKLSLFDLLLILTGFSNKCHICLRWRDVFKFKKKTFLIWDYIRIGSSNWLKMRENKPQILFYFKLMLGTKYSTQTKFWHNKANTYKSRARFTG